MCRIIKVGVGGFSHLAFKKIKVVLNSRFPPATDICIRKQEDPRDEWSPITRTVKPL